MGSPYVGLEAPPGGKGHDSRLQEKPPALQKKASMEGLHEVVTYAGLSLGYPQTVFRFQW